MPDSPITQRDVQSLRDTLDKLDRTIQSFQDRVENTYARKDVTEGQFRDLRRDVEEHAAWITWAQRLIIGAVMLALLGAVLVQTGTSP